jgi:hypothetical protein
VRKFNKNKSVDPEKAEKSEKFEKSEKPGQAEDEDS